MCKVRKQRRFLFNTLVALVLVAGCSRDSQETNRSAPSQTSSTALTSEPVPSATVFPSSTASTKAASLSPSDDEDDVLRQLRTAPISALTIVSWSRPGVFVATLDRSPAPGSVQVSLSLAVDQHPITHRRPLAFARLARALGMHVVPPTIVRRISTGELGSLFGSDGDVRSYMSAHAAIQNDGTIDALIIAPSRGDASTAWKMIPRHDVVLDEVIEARAWAHAVASIEPVPNENKSLLRDYVEALVLDYLSGNIMRRTFVLDDARTELLAVDNDTAFSPSKNFANAEAELLERLKPIVRFPRSLLDALTKLDRVRAREVFLAGTFDTWLLSPRTLMLLDERRSTLMTLVASRITEYGEAAVLSL